MSEPTRGSWRLDRWLRVTVVLLTLLVSARVLHRDSRAAGDLRITPDEVEYALCAQRLATLGRYDLELDGVSVPPHSTPWFSALLAPAYVLGADEPGNGIWILFASSIGAMLVLLHIGERTAGPLAGAAAVIAVLSTPLFPYVSRLIMTDAPAVTIALSATWLFLVQRERAPSLSGAVAAGVLVAAGFALRSVYLSLLAPFAWLIAVQPSRRVARALCLVAPLALVLVANALYNQSTFGDWRRTGYQFWCAVPYDYPELLLSLSNVRMNVEDTLSQLALPSLWLGLIGVGACLWRVRARATPFLVFAAVTALPITALHFVYFYADLRFHLWLIVAASAAGGIGLAALTPQRWRDRREPAIAALALAFFLAPDPIEVPAQRRRTSDQVKQVTPNDALVISGLEPVYLQALERVGSKRTFIAASRDVEFASKLLTRVRVPREIANPTGPFDHRAPGLVAGGSVEAHARTADEMTAEIERTVREGRPVFLERRFLAHPGIERRILGASLRLEEPQARISRVTLAR